MTEELSNELGQRLKELRKHLQINQKDFAAQIGVANSYMCEIEKGKIKPGIEYFGRIIDAFNVNPLFLLKGEEPKILGTKSEARGSNEGTIKIDTGSNIDELYYYLEHSPMVLYAVLEFFQRYKFTHKKDIDAEMKEREGRRE